MRGDSVATQAVAGTLPFTLTTKAVSVSEEFTCKQAFTCSLATYGSHMVAVTSWALVTASQAQHVNTGDTALCRY
jgi:hypothetical protein